eukprot:555316_1
MKIKIAHWHAVAVWKWKVKEEDCGICRQPFDGTCPKCTMPGDDCPPVWGNCNHHFHMHCIMKWLQQQRAQDRCPLCRQPWEIKVDEVDDENMDDQKIDVSNNSNQIPPVQQQRPSVRRALQLD